MANPLHPHAPHSLEPLQSIDDAQQWIRDLDAAGCLFHFDDHPEDLIATMHGVALWSPEAAALVAARLAEARAIFEGANMCIFEWSRPLWGLED